MLLHKWETEIIDIPWLVLDFEFSGMSKGETVKDEHIIELAIIKYVRGYPVDHIVTLLNIGDRPISQFSSRMTGIYPSHLVGKPTFEQISSRIFSMFDDGPLVVAHNARRDVMVLVHEFLRVGIELRTEYLCTYKMASTIFYNIKRSGLIKNFRLSTLAKYCDVEFKNAHRAQDDAEVCAKILVYMLKSLLQPSAVDGKVHRQEISLGSLRGLGYICGV